MTVLMTHHQHHRNTTAMTMSCAAALLLKPAHTVTQRKLKNHETNIMYNIIVALDESLNTRICTQDDERCCQQLSHRLQ